MMEHVKKTIMEKLEEIEKTEHVKILHCVESGSRAWGFPSPDSDYDVRFIYVRPKEYYLRLEKTRDVIEWQLDDTLDINGWDLQKMLRLLYSSNPTVFEWKNSPIVYKTRESWKDIAECIDAYFCPKKGMYHYLSMAKRNYRNDICKDSVKLKKYFYVLRPLLACEHIQQTFTPPPMLFDDLMPYLDSYVGEEVRALLEQKAKISEMGESRPIYTINRYIEEKIDFFETAIQNMPDKITNSWEKLNELFLEQVD